MKAKKISLMNFYVTLLCDQISFTSVQLRFMVARDERVHRTVTQSTELFSVVPQNLHMYSRFYSAVSYKTRMQ
jgi:hypothetical protein